MEKTSSSWNKFWSKVNWHRTNTTALLFAAAIIIAALALGHAFMKRNQTQGVISVTGLGKKDFTSDMVVWEGSFSKTDMAMKTAAAALNKDRQMIEDYLLKNGINANEMLFSAVNISQRTQTHYSQDGRVIGETFAGYQLSQSVQISSKDIEKVDAVSRNITQLISDGVMLASGAPRYYYSKLSDLKLELISEATQDARARVEKIAEKSGGKIGNLVNAQMGVFQITGKNSDEEYSEGGTFNTSSKEKSATITMRLTYRIR